MDAVFKKMNFKSQSEILILHPPDSFQENIKNMGELTKFTLDIKDCKEIAFCIVFVTTLADIESTIQLISPKLIDDAVLWYCYPKGTSKRYKCNFNRDTGWDAMGALGLESVRMVAIDEDWSALRFRQVKYIKNFTRHDAMILSEDGKKRKKD